MLNDLLSVQGLENWFAIDLAAKSTLLVALAAGLVLLLNRSSAAIRHRVWTLLFLALLILPLVTVFAPGFTWQVIPRSWQAETITASVPPTPSNATSVPTFEENEPSLPTMGADVTIATSQNELTNQSQAVPPDIENKINQSAEAAPVSSQTTSLPALDWSKHALGLIWLGGILLTLLPLVTGLLGNWRLRKQSRRLDDAGWQQTMTDLSNRLGLHRPVTLLSGGPHQMPMTFGLRKPCVVLPNDAANWTEERRQVVLLHELAHVRRFDVPLQMIARLGCALFWFHPLVWWSARQMRLEREHACDDCVLLAGQEPSVYASQLLEIAHQLSNQAPFTTAALCMARKSQLEGRLLAVLDSHRSRAQVGMVRTLGCLLLALLFVSALGVVHPTLQVETLLSASEKEQTPDNQKSESESEKYMLITGTVLSPEGKPLPSADIEIVAYDSVNFWRRIIPGTNSSDYYQTKSDDSGRFRIEIPRNISRPRKFMWVIVSTAEGLLIQESINPGLMQSHLELKLEATKKVQVQLIDTAGNPVVGIQPLLSLVPRERQSPVSSNRRYSRSDQEGYVSIQVPESWTSISLSINDDRLGLHQKNVDISDEPTSVVLEPAQFLNGHVIDAESGQAIAGAEVMILERPYHRVYTNADGSFRISRGIAVNTLFPPGENIVHVYPPPQSDYLFHALEWKWPNNRLSDASLTIKLKRGIIVTGRVTEKETGKPVPKATLFFEPQQNNNPLFDKSSESRFSGSDMKYVTDADGRFRLPVWPGPGYLIVEAPTLDYVHQEFSWGEKYDGKPGLMRAYYDAVAPLNLKPGTKAEPLKLELERGVTLIRKVVRPDGQPASGKAYARSYLPFQTNINSNLDALLIEDGRFELPGFHPKKSIPLYFIDFEHHCGKMVSSLEPDETPIRLEKCGAASFQFEDDKGNPLVDYNPLVMIVVTPGAPATGFIQPDQPLWCDYLFWQNILRPAKFSQTDAAGRVTVKDLIPGATYRLQYAKDHLWESGYEFTVRSGETTDVGKVVLQLQR